MAPRLRPLLTPPNDGIQKENKLDLRVALKKGAGQVNKRHQRMASEHDDGRLRLNVASEACDNCIAALKACVVRGLP